MCVKTPVAHTSLLCAGEGQEQLVSHAILLFARSDVIPKNVSTPPSAHQLLSEAGIVQKLFPFAFS